MTNRGLNIAKQVALNMLYADVQCTVSAQDTRTLYHPFVSDRIYIEEHPNWQDEKEELIYQAQDLFDLYDMVRHDYYYEFLKRLKKGDNGLKMNEKDYAEALKSLWYETRWNNTVQPPEEMIKVFFDYADKDVLMSDEERELISSLPAEFEVYRAYQESSKESFSDYDFFLTKETAIAKRKIYLDEEIIIETRKVKKQNVLAYNKERQILVAIPTTESGTRTTESSENEDATSISTTKSELGTLIKQLRMNRRMTLVELARLVGVHRSLITRWEQGDRIPKELNIRKIEEIFNVRFSFST